MTTRIGVVGAFGRMGAETCRAVDAADDLVLAAAVSPSHEGQSLDAFAGTDSGITVTASLDALVAAEVDVAVEFTVPTSVDANLVGILERGIHAVVGATGLGAGALARARDIAAEGPARAVIAPNFALGAVLMMRFAAEAAKHLGHAEIVELHHDRKVDAPSGTALRTAELIAEARGDDDGDARVQRGRPAARGELHAGVPVHSVRLPGLLAHQEVLFGGAGQALTIRHDTFDRSAFMPGVLLACRRVAGLDGLVIGLEHLLDRDP